MISSFVSSSTIADAAEAGYTAANSAVLGLEGKPPHLLFVFCSVAYDQQVVLDAVKRVAGDARIVGASTAGEIGQSGPIDGHSVTVMAISAQNLTFTVGLGEGLKEHASEAGKTAAEHMKNTLGTGRHLKIAMMFADGLSGNSSAALRGILEVLGNNFPVVGGSAGDDAQYKKTYQYADGKVYSDAVVVLGIAGPLSFSLGVKHGWMPISPTKTVTRAEGSVIYEIDGTSAISLYEDYFGKEASKELASGPLAKFALSYPLGIVAENHEDEYLLRAPFFAQPDGSIVCGGEVPQGSTVRIMMGDSVNATKAASSAGHEAMQSLGAKPEAALIFSCHVRDKLFGGMTNTAIEIDAVRREIGADVPMAGFYTYAEQAPINGESRNIEKCNPSVHNETIVICLLRSE